MFRRSALIAASIALASTAAQAQVQCAAGTLASYIALGAGGCRYNGLVFSDFGGFSVVGTGALAGATFSTSEIQLTPTLRSNEPGGPAVSGLTAFLARPLGATPLIAGYTANFTFAARSFGGGLFGGRVDIVGYGIGQGDSEGATLTLPSVANASTSAIAGFAFGTPSIPIATQTTAAFLAAFPRTGTTTFGAQLVATQATAQFAVVGAYSDLLIVHTAPEPATLALAGAGVALLGAWARRRRAA